MPRVVGFASAGALAAVLLAVTVSGAPARTANVSLLGTWKVTPVPGSPWASPGHIVTIRPSSASVAGPIMNASGPNATAHFCNKTDETPPTWPGATFYTLTYDWLGGGTMYGCTINPSYGAAFFTGQRYISLRTFADHIGGNWQSKWDDPKTSIALDLHRTTAKPSSGGGGGGSEAGVPEPDPGDSLILTGPDTKACSVQSSGYRRAPADIPFFLCDILLRNTAADVKKQTLVAAGERPHSRVVGEAVANCVLLGPDVLPIDASEVKRRLRYDTLDDFYREYAPADITYEESLRLCMTLVAEFVDPGKLTSARATAAASTACHAQWLRLVIRRSGGRYSVTLRGPTGSSARYSCTLSGGTMKIRVKTPNLSTLFGPRVRLGVYRWKHAARRKARLTITIIGGGPVTPKPPPPPPQPKPAPPPAATSFTLQPGLTTVTNTHTSELTIDASGRTAHFKASSGAIWTADYSWTVPQTITAGKTYTITLHDHITSVTPDQPLLDQMNALAPDFGQAIQAHWPDNPDVSKTFTATLAADQAGSKDIGITIGFISSGVTYHYRK